MAADDISAATARIVDVLFMISSLSVKVIRKHVCVCQIVNFGKCSFFDSRAICSGEQSGPLSVFAAGVADLRVPLRRFEAEHGLDAKKIFYFLQ
ncbi:hypothetical protein [Pelagimonas sp. KU-00592-HH]|uniref:hypothetical protein n=1 Tax=Pelagimonas sp. KU-00592-HH TaxID=3127651 RepID=UPI003342B206